MVDSLALCPEIIVALRTRYNPFGLGVKFRASNIEQINVLLAQEIRPYKVVLGDFTVLQCLLFVVAFYLGRNNIVGKIVQELLCRANANGRHPPTDKLQQNQLSLHGH